MLRWTQARLAERAGVARKTIADFETEARTLHFRTRRDITMALEDAGISFIADGQTRDALSRGTGERIGVIIAPPRPD